jgi:hypothetical protein
MPRHDRRVGDSILHGVPENQLRVEANRPIPVLKLTSVEPDEIGTVLGTDATVPATASLAHSSFNSLPACARSEALWLSVGVPP